MDDDVRSCPYGACSRCEYGKFMAQFRSRTPKACRRRFVTRHVPLLPYLMLEQPQPSAHPTMTAVQVESTAAPQGASLQHT
ncbi:MAG: hypothetical protein O3A51_05285 [Verrucomicrobia bacterium]|nr:hypothetical protein [Verrucomicrobiota bacterium]